MKAYLARARRALSVAVLLGLLVEGASAQEGAVVRGQVSFDDGSPVHGAVVLVVGTRYEALTDDDGSFEIDGVTPGTYELLAQREHLTANRQTVTVGAGETAVADFELLLTPVHEELTITAAPSGQETVFEAFNAITTLDSFELITNPAPTLGEALKNEPGVAMRSFGPGAARPIIRGFDGDRVLIMQDGIRTGDLSSSSGDHHVPIDPNALERVEIVRGPATLLYGSNAVGGVINAITPQEAYRNAVRQGTRGQLSFDVGSADGQAGSNASMQHGQGNVLFWAGGGARRSSDYDTPLGPVENSASSLTHGRAGAGYFGDRAFFRAGVSFDNGRFGVPFAGDFHGHHGHEDEHHDDDHDDDHDEEGHEEELFVDLESRRRVGRVDFGLKNLSNRVIEGVRFTFNVIDYTHDEIEIDEGLERIGTTFENRTYVGRVEFNQRQSERLSGRFGMWAQAREFAATGFEALAPRTDQVSFAAFASEELDFGRVRVQLAGRFERNDFTVGERAGGHHDHDDDHDDDHGDDHDDDHDDDHGDDHGALEAPGTPARDFNGASVSAGLQADIGSNGSFVANLTHSHRAPALEELYNFGPHVGTLTFEVGNPNLESEQSLALDVSLRYQAPRARASINAYAYNIDNFVFMSLDGDMADGLPVAEFLQADSLFKGFDAEASMRVGDAVWANVGVGVVDAALTATNEALPRIPPLRGTFSVDFTHQGLTVSPEVIVAARQDNVYGEETVTDGYSVVNLNASYVWARPHVSHIVSVTGYNLTNELYRSHTSFIKDLAPEIGRGIKFGYSMRFF